MKDRDILLTGDKWTIAVNIELDDYINLIRGMKFALAQVQRNIETHRNPNKGNFDIHWEEIKQIERLTEELETDLESVSKLLFEEIPIKHPMTGVQRNKRGLINLVGYGFKHLFGTADANDVRRLNSVCDNLRAFQQNVVHATEQQLSYMHTLDEETKINVKNTVDLAKTLRDSIQKFSLRIGGTEVDLTDLRSAVQKQARYSAAIREIELAILEFKFSLVQLQESLDVTSVGKLSSNLISPNNLSDLLKQVSLHLPAGTSMLTGLTIEEMYVYYAVANVHATATSRGIRLFIDIPLKAADRYFELYQVHSLPFFHQGIKKFIKIYEPFTYLAVAENRRFFTTLSTDMLAECTTDCYTVCPSNLVLRNTTNENCLMALFMGKTSVILEKCKRIIFNDFEPIWIRSPDAKYWVYSLKDPTRVTMRCRSGDSPLAGDEVSELTLSYTGSLPNTSNCYIFRNIQVVTTFFRKNPDRTQ
jgi:hypothetical protein